MAPGLGRARLRHEPGVGLLLQRPRAAEEHAEQITGSILTGVFASKAANPDGGNGLLAGGAALLGVQIGAVVVVFCYTAAATAAVLLLVKAVTPLRVELRAELEGLDRQVHGEEAYRGGSAAGGLGESVILLPSERVPGSGRS